MEIIRNFMVYQPRFVNKHIENYLSIIGNLTLESSERIDDFPENLIRNDWHIPLGEISLDEYIIKYKYVMEISSKKYPFVIYIRETHMKDKYAPADSAGYFVVSCLFVIEKDTRRNGFIHNYINHMIDTLDDKIENQIREINNKTRY